MLNAMNNPNVQGQNTPTTPVPVVVATTPPIVQAQQTMQTPASLPTTPSTQPNYATFWTRFTASFIDCFILGFGTGILSIPFTILSSTLVKGPGDQITALIIGSISQLINLAIYFAYSCYFLTKNGATLGKQVMKIKVLKMESPNQKITVMDVFLREIVGKILSSILILGYLTMPGDKNKQTWHDKIAGTIVVKTN